ncbi:hypothetical protein OHB24_18660 [Kribbella sp. NBC_00482]|uniref:hypothetical protein n=1 Tax=Kribbella sp. NBC_00482 TaxID=2975968 RepID=UPI002E18C254
MKLNRASTVAASALLLGGLAAAPAGAATAAPTATTAATAACQINLGSITAGGDMANAAVTATSPATVKRSTGPHMFSPGLAKLASTWTISLGVGADYTWSGNVIVSGTLYGGAYGVDSTGKPFTSLQSRGVGYIGYKAIETSWYWGKTSRSADYRLRGDGVLYRYVGKAVTRWAGYSSVKTMALISETATYDTFLATTNGGALYTIHIPVTGAPVVKKVRTSTWQGFEYLVAEKCGTQSTLLAGIDKDTGSAYLYAVGHAAGASTVIKGLGKVPGDFKDPIYFLNTAEGNAPLFGE